MWVDALCILQAGLPPRGDNDQKAAKKDWQTESRRLWETFRGAYVTICAASSTSCQDSFLQDRQIQPGLVVKLRTADGCENATSSADPSESRACEIIPWPTKLLARESLASEDPFHPIIIESHWYSRGWVHQEISFSRRLLVFGANMVFMRFGHLQVWENGCQVSSSWRLREIDPSNLQSEPFRLFADEVKVLYEKQITVETDRLPALSGLASQVARVTKSQYLAGLWQDNLANDLIFSVGPNRGEMRFDERVSELSEPHSRARPSWSWAGHGRSFKHRPGLGFDSWLEIRDDWTLDCIVLEAVAEADGENPFGAVKRAHLSLRCRVITLEELLSLEPSAEEPSTILRHGELKALEGLTISWDTNNDAAPADVMANISLICTSEKPVSRVDERKRAAGLVVYPAADGEFY